MSYPNMSYCAVENTDRALAQIIGMMQEHDTLDEFIESRSPNEQRAWRNLADKIEYIQELINEEDME